MHPPPRVSVRVSVVLLELPLLTFTHLALQTKKLRKQYTAFSEFVRDVALIAHNAQVYNRPSSEYFRNANRLRELFMEELQKLVDDGTITAEDAVLPDLGEIPDAEDSLPEDEDEDVEEDDEDDDEDDEEDD